MKNNKIMKYKIECEICKVEKRVLFKYPLFYDKVEVYYFITMRGSTNSMYICYDCWNRICLDMNETIRDIQTLEAEFNE